MARPLRIEYPGAFYHVTGRGNEKKPIFLSDEDRKKFLSLLESSVERYKAIVHCYVLMDNHYHLLLETPQANLSAVVHYINGNYTSYFNKKHDRCGHLFQGRYKAILVDKDAYAVELSRYIHLNPVRAGFGERFTDSLISSLFAYAQLTGRFPWLTTSFILSYFGRTKREQVKQYIVFVSEGLEKELLENPLKKVFASTILGDSSFISWVRQNFIEEEANRDIPALGKLHVGPTIDEIKKATENATSNLKERRRIALYLAHRFSGKNLSEIAGAFGNIGPSAVSQNSSRIRAKMSKDESLRKTVEGIEEALKSE